MHNDHNWSASSGAVAWRLAAVSQVRKVINDLHGEFTREGKASITTYRLLARKNNQRC
jgi:hypothetical protein